ncbi:hypothetical protein ES703_32063 [subsurface metagenome]
MHKHPEAERSKLPPKLLAGIILAIFFGVALCLRICLPYDQVFGSDWIKFTSADAYYHMRVVDNLVHNFPHLIRLDPYLLSPYSVGVSSIHFFDWLLAAIIWVIGLGSPTQHTIDVIGVYFPAILGALTVIPVYFIGKELFNRWAGIISAALIALLPGEFMGRSILGFTDYDVAGTLFTTIAMLFLILAIKAARQRHLTFNHLKHPDRAIITKPIIYSLLAGIFLGIYLFTWPGALLFVLIIFIYFVIQFIIDHLKRRPTDYLCLVSGILFLVAILMFVPASHQMVAKASLVIALIIPLVLSGISRLLTSRQIKPAYYPLTVVILGLAGFFIFRIINPTLFNSMVATFGIISPGGGIAVTTLEMQPLTFSLAWGNFTTGFVLGLISLAILIYLVIKQGNAEKSLLVVWSLVILVIALMQRRFAGYLAVNVALLTGYLSILIFFVIRSIIAYLRGEPGKYLSHQILESPDIGELIATPTDTTPKRVEGGKAKPKQRYQGGVPGTTRHMNMALSIIVVFFLVIFPNIKTAIDTAKEVRFVPSDAWCQSLSWLKANTPDPFGDPDFYYELYEPPRPQPAYCVLAWWDYGYWIARIAHRVPNTNPAQGGVGEVANFFLSTDEESAGEIRGRLKTAYVIIDYDTAIMEHEIVGSELRVTGKFWAVATRAGREPTEFFDLYYQSREGRRQAVLVFYPEYYHSLSTRLYNFDGKAVTPQSSWVISYQERMSPEGELIKEITSSKEFSSYEEAVAYVSSQESANYKIVSDNPFVSPVPLDAVKHYQLVYSSESCKMQPGVGMVPVIKIFEYVK